MVDFPAPFGPMRPTSSPFWIWKLTPLSACFSWCFLLKSDFMAFRMPGSRWCVM